MKRTSTPRSDSVAAFGTELRIQRERMSWRQEELAERLGWSSSLIASIEQGRRKPPYGLGEQADIVFGLPGVMTRMAERARADSTPFGDLMDLQERATSIRTFDMRVVPGLLQTEAYARAVIEAASEDLPPEEIDRQVETRMRRQCVLDRDDAPTLHVILDEAVLCRPVGEAKVMREQLLALADPRRRVTVQVLPFAAGEHPAIEAPLTVIRLPDEPDVAYVDGWTRGYLVDTSAEVLRARRTFDRLAALALPPEESAELIMKYVKERYPE